MIPGLAIALREFGCCTLFTTAAGVACFAYGEWLDKNANSLLKR